MFNYCSCYLCKHQSWGRAEWALKMLGVGIHYSMGQGAVCEYQTPPDPKLKPCSDPHTQPQEMRNGQGFHHDHSTQSGLRRHLQSQAQPWESVSEAASIPPASLHLEQALSPPYPPLPPPHNPRASTCYLHEVGRLRIQNLSRVLQP